MAAWPNRLEKAIESIDFISILNTSKQQILIQAHQRPLEVASLYSFGTLFPPAIFTESNKCGDKWSSHGLFSELAQHTKAA